MNKIDDYSKSIGSIQKFWKEFYFKINYNRRRDFDQRKYEKEPKEKNSILKDMKKKKRIRILISQKRKSHIDDDYQSPQKNKIKNQR